MSNYHAIKPIELDKPTHRMRPEAAPIAEKNQGLTTKILLSNDRLSSDDRKAKPRLRRNATNIAVKSAGGAAKSCINPSKPKWSGKVHWKRPSPPITHSTF
ncbi:hypothetical protein PHET_05138 [Paragonimus heterotremus]|uniref:Uncharacterized protein n=1 Tax=Paragonimus heterotremus TaxID=100268 RepID=A0A8J4WIS3_9TREM|nr:hypothetical protein PHET_05138 [Paragonimus heterotremus]